MSDNVFRCYAYKGHGGYYTVCLDLMLIDRRDTLEEALAALDENIMGYLQSVRSSGWEEQLIPRPCPWREWAHYYWLYILNAFAALLGKRVADFMPYNRKELTTGSPEEIQLIYA